MAEILILDDDALFARMLAEHIKRLGHTVDVACSLEEGVVKAQAASYDIVFLDLHLPDGSGLDVLPDIRSGMTPPEVIIVTGFGSSRSAEIALQCGAWDFLHKHSAIQEILLSLTRALKYRASRKSTLTPVVFYAPDMVGSSPAFHHTLNLAAQAAGSMASVLITGETGVGKEVLARSIHANSKQSEQRFVVVDCASLPDTLANSILFGHEKGAYTGADSQRTGLVAQADGGTLFLDEVGEMPLDMQKVFLRVLQEQLFRPIGAAQEKRSNFRLIAATNRDLVSMAKTGHFRQDLLFRLLNFVIPVPALRYRREDTPLLITFFLRKYCKQQGLSAKSVNEDFSESLESYVWPGNIRELSQAISSAVTACGEDPVLFAAHLPIHIRLYRAGIGEDRPPALPAAQEETAATPASVALLSKGDAPQPYKQLREQFEKDYLLHLSAAADHNIESACRLSGISRPHLYTLLKKHGLKL